MFQHPARRTAALFGLALIALALGVLVLAPASTSAQASPSATIPQVTLSPANEVPPVTATVSGFFSATLHQDSLDFDLSADGATFTMAHLHMAAKGVNGPVVVPLYNNTAGQGAIHVTGTITAKDLTGPLANNWQGFTAALAAGEIYVNVHSADHPAGVARAQLPATSLQSAATPVAPNTGNGAAASGGWSGSVLFGSAVLSLLGAVVLAYAWPRRRQE